MLIVHEGRRIAPEPRALAGASLGRPCMADRLGGRYGLCNEPLPHRGLGLLLPAASGLIERIVGGLPGIEQDVHVIDTFQGIVVLATDQTIDHGIALALEVEGLRFMKVVAAAQARPGGRIDLHHAG